MKQVFGARPDGSFTHSTRLIVANRRNERGVLGPFGDSLRSNLNDLAIRYRGASIFGRCAVDWLQRFSIPNQRVVGTASLRLLQVYLGCRDQALLSGCSLVEQSVRQCDEITLDIARYAARIA